MKTLSAFLSILLPSVASAGVNLAITQMNIEKFPEIAFYVSASDEQNNPVLGLLPGHFDVKEDADKVTVKELIPSGTLNDPLYIVAAFDRSGSMKGQPIDDAKNAVNTFIQEMRPTDQVGLVAFDSKVDVLSPLVADKAGLSKTIDNISVGKDTALNDGIMKSIDTLSPIKGRRAVIILTDGKENKSKIPQKDLINEISKSGIMFFLIGMGEEIDKEKLIYLADAAQGQLFFARESNELPALYQMIAKQMVNQYRLVIESPKSLDSKWHTLTFSVRYPLGEGTMEKKYLATLKPVLDRDVLIGYTHKSGRQSLFKICLILLIPILFLTLLCVLVWRKRMSGMTSGQGGQ